MKSNWTVVLAQVFVWAVVIGVVGLLVPFVVSKEKARNYFADNTTWTPANQVKYPNEYMSYLKRTIQKKTQECDVMEHKINLAINGMQQKKSAYDRKLSRKENELEMLKNAAKENSEFTSIAVGDRKMSKPTFEKYVVQLAEEVEASKAISAKLAQAIRAAESKKDEIAAVRLSIDGVKFKLDNSIIMTEMKESGILNSDEFNKFFSGIESSLDSLAQINDFSIALDEEAELADNEDSEIHKKFQALID